MFDRYVEINYQRRHLMVINNDIGRFPQHYVKRVGWQTCLDRWVACPFCEAKGGTKYQRKIKYYFDVIELDRDSAFLAPKILLLSKSRGESLIEFFQKEGEEFLYVPFYFEKLSVGAKVDTSSYVLNTDKILDLIRHDWNAVCKPLSIERARDIVQNDPYEYPNI